MEKDKKSSTVDFLNNIEDNEIFKEEEKVEDVVDVEEDNVEKDVPFHKDPKILRFIDKQVEKRVKDIKPSAEQQFRKEVTEEINLPSSFVELVGNDTPEKVKVLKDLSNYFGGLKGEARKEFLAEMEQREQAARDADIKAQEELDSYFEEIEENFNVDLSSNTASAKKLRGEFIDYVRKIAPKNAEGEVTGFPDLGAAFEEFQDKSKRTAPVSRAKELASRGMTRSTDAGDAAPKFVSGARDPWKQVENHFSKLKAKD